MYRSVDTPSHNLRTMAKKRKLGDIGAVGKAKMKALHPSEPLRIKYGTAYERDYLDALEIVRSDKGKVTARGKVVDRYFVQHPFFPDIEFKVGRRNFTVEDEAAVPFEDKVACPAGVAARLSNHKEKVWMSTMVLDLRKDDNSPRWRSTNYGRRGTLSTTTTSPSKRTRPIQAHHRSGSG